MNASAAIADSPLRTHCSKIAMGPGLSAGVLAAQSVDILFQVCLPPLRLCLPVSLGDFTISRRTVMDNAG
jgi:hypothetical protein